MLFFFNVYLSLSFLPFLTCLRDMWLPLTTAVCWRQRGVIIEVQTATSAPWTGLNTQAASSSRWRANSSLLQETGWENAVHLFCQYVHVHVIVCASGHVCLCVSFSFERNSMCVTPSGMWVMEHKASGKATEWQARARREEKGGVQERGSGGGIWGRQNSSQHSVACTSANERVKGSVCNYTEIMAISWNHGNSSRPAPLHPHPTPPLLPHSPCRALILLYPTEMFFFFFFVYQRKDNQCRAFCQLMNTQVFASVPLQLGDMHKTLCRSPHLKTHHVSFAVAIVNGKEAPNCRRLA